MGREYQKTTKEEYLILFLALKKPEREPDWGCQLAIILLRKWAE